MDFIPSFSRIGPSDAPNTALVLHGILGAGRNWRSFIRKLSVEHPDWQFVLVDHRWHGDSGEASGPNTVEGCADDLGRLLESENLQPDLVMGHSFGGKVALAFARDVWVPSLSQIIVLDATPGAFSEPQNSSNNEVVGIIHAIRGTTTPAADRREVKSELVAAGIPIPIVEWLATSLRRDEDGWRWCFDLDAVETMIQSYFSLDFWPFLDDLPPSMAVAVVRAGRSDRWSDDEVARFALSQAEELVLPDAGHWLHVDSPAALRDLLAPFF